MLKDTESLLLHLARHWRRRRHRNTTNGFHFDIVGFHVYAARNFNRLAASVQRGIKMFDLNVGYRHQPLIAARGDRVRKSLWVSVEC